jgi:hypothetical protein
MLQNSKSMINRDSGFVSRQPTDRETIHKMNKYKRKLKKYMAAN